MTVSIYRTPRGFDDLVLVADGDALTGLWFDGQANFGETLSEPYEEGPLPVFAKATLWLDAYFEGRNPGFTPPLHLRGTTFRRKVWKALMDIPFGQKLTYGELAQRLNSSPRAVGGALAHNPVSLIVPCHRVMGTSGKLTGYAGGVERKRKLLELEGI